MQTFVAFWAPVSVETVTTEEKTQAITFRCLLLTKCQQEFEKDKQEDEVRDAMMKGVEAVETVRCTTQHNVLSFLPSLTSSFYFSLFLSHPHSLHLFNLLPLYSFLSSVCCVHIVGLVLEGLSSM